MVVVKSEVIDLEQDNTEMEWVQDDTTEVDDGWVVIFSFLFFILLLNYTVNLHVEVFLVYLYQPYYRCVQFVRKDFHILSFFSMPAGVVTGRDFYSLPNT